mgnify:CR=1 FL=1
MSLRVGILDETLVERGYFVSQIDISYSVIQYIYYDTVVDITPTENMLVNNYLARFITHAVS